jgi:hypothetical protein
MSCPSFLLSCGATAQIGPSPPLFGGIWITLRHTPHSVGLLWTSDQSIADTSTGQHTTLNTQQGTDIHASGGIRTHDPSKRSAEGPHLIPRGHWDRHCPPYLPEYDYTNGVGKWRQLLKRFLYVIPCFLLGPNAASLKTNIYS